MTAGKHVCYCWTDKSRKWEKLYTMQERKIMWISVKDKLPVLNQDVLVFDGKHYSVGCYYGKDNGGWAACGLNFDEVTHWAPSTEMKQDARDISIEELQKMIEQLRKSLAHASSLLIGMGPKVACDFCHKKLFEKMDEPE